MTLFFTVMLLVIAAIVANVVYAIYPKIPLAFYQIGAGVLLSLVPIFSDFHLEPEVFLLVIIAPLMFNDGQTVDTHALRKNFNSTLSLAIVLALVTILIGGFLTHLVWTVMPLALCFALAAIVTPTDAVAVKSITNDIDMPEHVMGALENESLFNDASGIVALDLALTAYSTGHFSFTQGLEHFLFVFFGGIVVGAILGLVIVLIRILFQRRTLDTIAVILPFNILTPFIVYLAAEELGLSGILAVVAAGIVHGLQGQRLRLTSTQTQVVTRTTWEIVTNLLNGFVFVLLGASAPSIWNDLTNEEMAHWPMIVGVSAGLYVLMLVLRFVWCMLNLVTLPAKETRVKDSALLAISGVHGTITLAMAFSLPLTIAGQSFPYRSSVILGAGLIILLSLIVPTLVLPILLPSKKDAFTTDEFNDILGQMVNFAIEQLRHTGASSAALPSVIEVLNSQKNQLRKNADSKVVHQLLEQAETAEHATVSEMIENGEVEAQIGWQYNRAAMFQTQFAFLSPIARVKMWLKLIFFRFFPQFSNSRYRKQMHRKRDKKLQWLKDHGYEEKYKQYKEFYEQHDREHDAHMRNAHKEISTENAQGKMTPAERQADYQKNKQKYLQDKQKYLKEHPEATILPTTTHSEHDHDHNNPNNQRQEDARSSRRITQLVLPMLQENQQRRQERRNARTQQRGLNRQQRQDLRRQRRNGTYSEEYMTSFRKVNEESYTSVMSFLDSVETDDNRLEVDVVRHFYNVRRNRFSDTGSSKQDENELFLMAFQYEYSYVQSAEKQEKLSSELVAELHKKISMDQMVYMQSGD